MCHISATINATLKLKHIFSIVCEILKSLSLYFLMRDIAKYLDLLGLINMIHFMIEVGRKGLNIQRK